MCIVSLLLVAGFTLVLQVSAAPATTIVVDTPADGPVNSDGYCSLREAIQGVHHVRHVALRKDENLEVGVDEQRLEPRIQLRHLGDEHPGAERGEPPVRSAFVTATAQLFGSLRQLRRIVH